MNTRIVLLSVMFMMATLLSAQPDRWQQRIHYQMDIDFDVTNHQFQGTQKVTYFNNSPDQLDKVFYHLYLNAFQPGSMMDVRSRNISDPDRRVGSRISKLDDSQIGYQKISSLKQNGKDVEYEVVGTILEVTLNEPIKPNSSVVFEMEFEAQVPIQIRRNGRNSAEGIDYSMAQWYPKMCEYDYQGWHANPYIGREFYGVWGDFEVNISIDSSYTLAFTGYLQNTEEIGHGYEEEGMEVKRPEGDKLTWKIKAYSVHDFLWAADSEYTHIKKKRKDGNVLHFFYVENERTADTWTLLPDIMDSAFDFIEEHYGEYPYKKYSFIMGGDGGMEYPMGTLITGNRGLGSLVGVSIHELMHTWYQMLMGTNESLYAWMDEGFTTYASAETMNYLRKEGKLNGEVVDDPQLSAVKGFARFAKTGLEESLTTHSDHFVTNRAYGTGSYTKGRVFLAQLEYIIGEENVDKGLLRYYDLWKFKHPNVNDFVRVMEKTSGLELDWYKEYMVHTTHLIDYSVEDIKEGEDGKGEVTLGKIGYFPMPLDVKVTYKDGSSEMYNIPLRLMRGNKPLADGMKLAEDWPWTNPTYNFSLSKAASEVLSVEIDPNGGMADVDLSNNIKSIKP
ncbi:MAG: M1 family metallopeptidase [Bacteroidota bacterium]